jgi:hypothetical protein
VRKLDQPGGASEPHAGWQELVVQLSWQTVMQRSLGRQSSDVVQSSDDPGPAKAQKQSPSVVAEQRQSSEPPQGSDGGGLVVPEQKQAVHGAEQPPGGGEPCAWAGVAKLVRTGADHTRAAPTPARLSTLRLERELPTSSSFLISSSMARTSLGGCGPIVVPGRARGMVQGP